MLFELIDLYLFINNDIFSLIEYNVADFDINLQYNNASKFQY